MSTPEEALEFLKAVDNFSKSQPRPQPQSSFKESLFSLESIQEAQENIQNWLNPRADYLNTDLYHAPKQGFYTAHSRINSKNDLTKVIRVSLSTDFELICVD